MYIYTGPVGTDGVNSMKFLWDAQHPADWRLTSGLCLSPGGFIVKLWLCPKASKHQYVFTKTYLDEAELPPAQSVADWGKRCDSQQEIQAESQDARRVEGVIDPSDAVVKHIRRVASGLHETVKNDSLDFFFLF